MDGMTNVDGDDMMPWSFRRSDARHTNVSRWIGSSKYRLALNSLSRPSKQYYTSLPDNYDTATFDCRLSEIFSFSFSGFTVWGKEGTECFETSCGHF